MTSEVCMMNRLAIVLAADSATTVTHWHEQGKEERYFKGANKIFQLSTHNPVGMMIYDSADLLSVPWEVIAKDFRRHLGRQTLRTITAYADAFFEFLDGNTRLFPVSVQNEAMMEAFRSAAYRMVFSFSKPDDPKQVQAAFDEAIRQRLGELLAMPWAPHLDQDLANQLTASYSEDLARGLVEVQSRLNAFPEPSDFSQLANLGIYHVLKEPEEFLGRAGLVFAGFGDDDIFPSMVEYISCGMVDGRHIAREGTRARIDHNQPAWLSAFAQTAMSDTFQLGVSMDVYGFIIEALDTNLGSLAQKVLNNFAAASGAVAPIVEPSLVAATRKAIVDQIMARARENHAYPLRRVLGALPIEEMAELAETLINLQSLKEKVTKPSASVGGPVDVAAITKSEGMVWIKRKLYFDQALNSRYMQRQAATHGMGEDQ